MPYDATLPKLETGGSDVANTLFKFGQMERQDRAAGLQEEHLKLQTNAANALAVHQANVEKRETNKANAEDAIQGILWTKGLAPDPAKQEAGYETMVNTLVTEGKLKPAQVLNKEFFYNKNGQWDSNAYNSWADNALHAIKMTTDPKEGERVAMKIPKPGEPDKAFDLMMVVKGGKLTPMEGAEPMEIESPMAKIKREAVQDATPKTEFQAYRAGQIAKGVTDEAKIAMGWKEYAKSIAAASREGASETAAKTSARIEATVKTWEKVLGRSLSAEEKRFMATRDIYGITSGGEGGEPGPSDPPPGATPKDKANSPGATNKPIERREAADGSTLAKFADGSIKKEVVGVDGTISYVDR